MEKAHRRIGIVLVGFACIWCCYASNATADFSAATLKAPKLPSADLRQLTTGDCQCWNGDWSSNGKWIVYQREKQGSNTYSNIYKIGVDGTEETQLTSGYYCDSKPQFSPNGKKIVFQRNMTPEGGTKVGEKASIWVMDAGGSNQKQVVAPGQDDKEGAQWPFWSPDGKYIAYKYGERNKKGLWIVKADGTGAQQLIAADFGEDPEKFMDWKPKGAGKGKQIVVSVQNDTPKSPTSRFNYRTYSRHLLLAEFDPKGLTPAKNTWLTDPENPICVSNAKWKPDGKRIAYMDDSNNYGDIWLMNPDGTDKVRLTDSASNGNACYSNPNWSPNGKYIIYWSDEGLPSSSNPPSNKKRIYIMSADGAYKNCLMSDENVRENHRGAYLLHFNRAGTKILFGGHGSGDKVHLFVLDLHK
jgi:Tol biopolymer transport system component